MRIQAITMTAAGNSATRLLDDDIKPFQVSLGLVVTGTVDVTVQYSLDSAQVKWWNHADLTNKTADATGTLISPVTGVRLVYNSGTGSATLSILQAGT